MSSAAAASTSLFVPPATAAIFTTSRLVVHVPVAITVVPVPRIVPVSTSARITTVEVLTVTIVRVLVPSASSSSSPSAVIGSGRVSHALFKLPLRAVEFDAFVLQRIFSSLELIKSQTFT